MRYYYSAEEALKTAKSAHGFAEEHPQFSRVISEILRVARLGHCQLDVTESLEDIVIVWLKEYGYRIIEQYNYSSFYANGSYTIGGSVPPAKFYTIKWADV